MGYLDGSVSLSTIWIPDCNRPIGSLEGCNERKSINAEDQSEVLNIQPMKKILMTNRKPGHFHVVSFYAILFIYHPCLARKRTDNLRYFGTCNLLQVQVCIFVTCEGPLFVQTVHNIFKLFIVNNLISSLIKP